MANESWKGNSGNWNDASQWNTAEPGGSDTAIFNTGSTYTVTFDTTASLGALAGYDAHGTFDMTGGSLDLLGGGFWNGAGFDAAGGTLDIAAGTLLLQNGNGTLANDIIGAGTLIVGSGEVQTLEPTATLGVGELFLTSSGKLVLGGDATDSGLLFGNGGATIDTAGHTLTLAGTNIDAAAVYLIGGGVLDVTGTLDDTSMSVAGTKTTLLDAGIVTEESYIQLGTVATDSATLAIASGATFEQIADNYYIYSGGGGTADVITDSGVFEKRGANGQSGILYTAFNQTSTGTVDIERGTLYFQQDNNNFAGRVTGAGTFELYSATGTFAAGSTIDVANMYLASGSDLVFGGSGTYAGSLYEDGNSVIDTQGFTETLTGHGTLTGYIQGGGTVVIAAGASYDISGLDVRGTNTELIVDGTVTQEYNSRLGYNSTDNTTIDIAQGGTYLLNGDSVNYYINSTGTTSIINSGLFEQIGVSLAQNGNGSTSSFYTGVYGNFTNTSTGTVDVAQGTLYFYSGQDSFDGKITGNGLFWLDSSSGTFASTATIDVAEFYVDQSGDAVFGSNRTYAGTFFDGGTGTVDTQGHTLTLSNQAYLDGYIVDNSVVDVTGKSEVGNGVQMRGTATTLIDAGMIIQDGNLYVSTAGTDQGTLNVATGATWDIVADSISILQNGTNTISNSGLFEKTSADGSSGVYGRFTNTSTGTVDVAEGTLFFQYGNDLFNGRVTGPGQFEVYSATATLGASASVDVASIYVAGGGDLVLGGDRTYAGNLYEGGGGNYIDTAGHTLTLTGSGYLDGYIIGGGTVVIAQGASYDTTGLDLEGVGTTLLIKGTVSSNGNQQLGNSATDTPTLDVTSTGTFLLYDDNTISQNGAATIINAGTIEKVGGDGGSVLSGNFTNTGVMKVDHGYIDLQGGTSNVGGTVEGVQLYFGSSETATVTLASVDTVGTIGVQGGDLFNIAGNGSFGDYFYIAGGANLNTQGHTLTLNGPGYINSYVSGGGTVIVNGTMDDSSMYVIGNSTEFLVNGTVTQDGYIQLGNTGSDVTTLDVSATGTYEFLSDQTIGQNGTDTIINAGVMEKVGFNGTSSVYATSFSNTGTLDIQRGTVWFYNGSDSFGGTIKGAGQLAVGSGAVGTLAAGATVSVANIYVQGGSDLVFAGGRTLTDAVFADYNAVLNLNGNSVTLGGPSTVRSYVIGPGTLTVAAGNTVEDSGLYAYGGATVVDKGTIVETYNNVTFANTGTDSDTLDINAGGTYDFAADYQIGTNGTFVLNNAGLLEKTGDTGTSYIYGNLNNTGTLAIMAGDIALQGTSTLGGVIDGPGALSLLNSGNAVYTLAAGATFNPGEVYIQGSATFKLGENLSYGQYLYSDYNAAIALNGNTLTLTGPNDVIRSYVTGPGMLKVAAGATLEDSGLYLYGGGKLEDLGTIIQGYNNTTFANTATDSDTLDIGATGTYEFAGDYQIGTNGTFTLTNEGLLEKVASTGNTYIYGNFVNTGTVNVETGNIILSGGGQLGGAIKGQGQLLLNGGTYTLESGLSLSIAELGFSGAADLVLGANETYSGLFNGGNAITNSTIDLNGHTLTLNGPDYAFNGVIKGAGTIVYDGTYDDSYTTVTQGAILLDQKDVTQQFGITVGVNGSDTAGIDILAGATYDIIEDGNINASGTATIANAGTFEKQSADGTSNVYTGFTNTGLILAQNGEIALQNNLVNDGNVDANSIFYVAGAVTADASKTGTFTIGGGGELYFNSSVASSQTVNFTGVHDLLVVNNPGSSVAGTITGFIAGDTIDVLSVQANGFTYAGNLLTLQHNGTAVATLDITGLTAGSIDLYSNGSNGTFIEYGQPAPVFSYPTAGIVGDNWNGSTASWTTAADWSAGLPGTLSGIGFPGGSYTVTFNTTAEVNYISGGNNGNTLDVTGGSLQIDTGNNYSGFLDATGGTITSVNGQGFYGGFSIASGALLVSDNNTLVLAGGTSTVDGTLTGLGGIELYNGQFTIGSDATVNPGTFDIQSAGVTLAADLNYTGEFNILNTSSTLYLNGHNATITSGQTSTLDGIIKGPGTFTITGPVVDSGYLEVLGGATFDLGATGTAAYLLQDQQAYLDSSVINIGSLATWAIDRNVGISNVGTASGTINNAGLFEKINQNSAISQINEVFNNTGTLQSGVTGAIPFVTNIGLTDGGTLGGVLTGTGVLNLQSGNFTLDPTNFTVAEFAITGGATTLTANETYSGVWDQNGAVFNLDGNTLTLNGNGDFLGNGTITGTGDVIIAGTGADLRNLYVEGGATIEVKGAAITDGWVYLDGASKVKIDAGGTLGFTTGTGISNTGTLGIVDNAGVLTKTDNTGASNIYDTFINENGGVINAVNNDIVLQAGGTIGGTLTGSEVDFGGGSGATYFVGGTSFSISGLGALGLDNGGGQTVELMSNIAYAGAFNDADGGGAIIDPNGHTLTLSGTADILSYVAAGAGVIDVANGGTALSQSMTYHAGTTLVVDGVVQQVDRAALGQAGTDTGNIVVDAGGTYDIVDNSYVYNNGSAGSSVTNSGLFEKTGNAGESDVNVFFTNNSGGTIAVDAGFIQLNGGATLAGTIEGAGYLYLRNNQTYTIDPTLNLSNLSELAINDGNTDVKFSSNFTYGNEFYFGDGFVDAGGHTLTLGGTSYLYGSGAIADGTMKITGTADVNAFYASTLPPVLNDGTHMGTLAGVLEDAGSVTQDNYLQLGYQNASDTGTMVVDAGATWNAITDTYIQSSGTTALVQNLGTFEKTGDYGNFDIDNPYFKNGSSTDTTAVLDVAIGTLSLHGGGDLYGTIEGAGTLDLRGGGPGQYTLEAGAVLSVATIALDDGGTVLTLEGDTTYDGTLLLRSAGINLNGHTLTLGGTADNLSYYNVANGRVIVTGTANFASDVVGPAAVLEDKGVMTQDAGGYIGNSGSDASALIIDAGATWDILNDSNLNNQGTSTISNAGLFEKTAGQGTSNVYSKFNNTGTIDVLKGNIELEAGGSLGGTMEGAGELDLRGGANGQYTLEAGAVLSVATLGLYDGGTALYLTGDASYAGRLILGSAGIVMNGHTLTLSGTQNYLGAYDINNGTVKVTGTADLANEQIQANATLEDAGLVTQDYQITIGNSGTDNSGMTIDVGATYDLLNNYGISAQGTATIQNDGTFLKSGQNGNSDIYARFNNDVTASPTAVLDVEIGTLSLHGGGALGGTIEGAGMLDLRGGGAGQYTLEPGAVLSVATLALDDGGTSLGLTGDTTYAGTLLLRSAGITMNGHTLTLSGTQDFLGAYNINTGVVKVTGTSDIYNEQIEANATLEVAGLVTEDYAITVGNSGSDQSGIVVDAGGTYDILNDYNINAQGTATISNAGLFEKTAANPQPYASTGISQVYASFSNTGTLDIVRGVIALGGGGTLGGTIEGYDLNIHNNGTYTLDATGAALSVQYLEEYDGNTDLLLGNNVTFANVFGISSGTIDLHGDTFDLTGSAQFTSSYINGAGRLIVGGSADIYNETIRNGATFEDAGLVTQDYFVTVGNGATDTAGIVVDAGATWDLLNDYNTNSGGTLDTIHNAGLFEKTGAVGVSSININFTNTGTVLSSSGTLAINQAVDNSAGTLGGTGTWEAIGNGTAGTIYIGGPAITNDNAYILLSGPNSEIYSGASPYPVLENSLTNIGTAGYLDLENGRNYITGETLTDAGHIILGGVSFDAAGLTLTATGHLQGYGTVTDPLNNGTIEANVAGQILDVTSAVTGSGTLLVDPGATIEIGASVAASQFVQLDGTSTVKLDSPFTMAGTFNLLNPGATLDFGSDTVTSATIINNATLAVTVNGTLVDYALKNENTLDRPAIIAPNTNGHNDVVIYRDAVASTITPNPATITNQHTGATPLSQALTVSNTDPTDGYSEALNAKISSSAPILSSGTIGTLVAGGTDSIDLTTGVSTATSGHKAGNALVTLYTEGVGADHNGTLTIGTQTIAVAGNVYDYADPILANGTIAFGEHHKGDTVSQALTLSNTTTLAAFQENLNASLGSASSAAFTATGTVSELAAGSIDTTHLVVGLVTNTAGTDTGTALLSLVSDGSTIDSLGTTTLASQTIHINGSVFNYATASAVSPNPVNFGAHHVTDTVNQTLTVANTAPTGAFSENLDAGFSSATSGITTHGTVSELAAGTSSSALSIGFNTGSDGTFSGSATIGLISDGSTIDTLGTTALASQTIDFTGAVYAYANPLLTTATIDLGATRVGAAALTGATTLADGTVADAYQEKLAYLEAAAPTGYGEVAPSSGTIVSGSSASLGFTLGTGTAGNFSGETLTVGLTSKAGASPLTDTVLSAATLTLDGKVYAAATAALGAATLDFGIVHTADVVSAQTLAISNTATGALTDLLTGSFASLTSPFSSGASLGAGVAVGGTGDLSVALNTGTAGVFSTSGSLSLFSHDADLADQAVSAGPVVLKATVDNYATAEIENISAGGAAVANGGTINLGTVVQNAAAPTLDLGVLNIATGQADLLKGSFVIANASGAFTDSGFASFSGLTAGGAGDTLPVVTLSTSNLGTFTETVTLDPTGYNSSGYAGTLTPEIVTVVGTVAVQGTGLNGTLDLTAATEGTALPSSTQVANFTDANTADAASGFTAQITWGDGVTSAGTVTGSNGTFAVTAGHTYGDEGSEPLGVTITKTSNSAQLVLNGTVAVGEGDTFTPIGTSFNATPGVAFSGVVGTFTDTNTLNVPGDFSATIDWGDGVTSAGTVTGSGGTFDVFGTHTYATGPGTDTVKVTITDDAPGTAMATATSTADISALLSGTVDLAAATEGTALASSTIASFTDTNTADAASGFTASITWGDGVTSAGTVTGTNGTFAVTAGHTYADEGSDPLGVTITRVSDGTTLALGGTVAVGEGDTITPIGTTINATPGVAFSGVVGTFTDTNTLNVAGDFSGTIDWGDGVTTVGTVTGGSGTFDVSGTHTYAASGQDTIKVTITDDAPGTAAATATSTADVAAGLSGNIVLTSATEGTALASSTIATFGDSNTADAASGFTAQITWGDGVTSAGTVTGTNGTFAVTAGHTYGDEGSDPLGVTITRLSDSTTLALSGTVTVGEGDTFTPIGTTIDATPGVAFSGVVGTFTDTNTLNVASDLSGTIDWGDGVTTVGTVTGGGGTFDVSGTHTYAASGQDTIKVTITDDAPGTATATATSTADVVGGLSGTIDLTTATEGVALASSTIASFTDSNTADAASGFTAQITWGDGVTSAGTVTGSNGTFAVTAGHTYADEGSDPLGITITKFSDSSTLALGGTVTVGEGDTFTPIGTSFNATPGVAFSGVVGTFTDSNTLNVPGDLTASINWGDGVTTVGTVTGGGGTFDVSGTHTYATGPGTDAVKVTITDDAPGTATATATSTADISALLSGTIDLAAATEGTALASSTIASFTDTNTADAASGFTASITWGDGVTSAGTVTGTNGTFAVTAGHTYADEGSDPLGVTITRVSDGTTLALGGTVAVGEGDTFTPIGITFNATAGSAFSGVVGTFTDTNTLNVPGDFTASIDWGDGVTTVGTVSAGGSGTFDVSGTHTYATGPGTDTVKVTITDDAPGTATATATSTADIAAASSGQTYYLTPGTDLISGGSGMNTIVAPAANTINKTDQIDGGSGGANTMLLKGSGTFDLTLPKILTDVQTIDVNEQNPGTNTTVKLRNGLNATINVAGEPGHPFGGDIFIIGANNSDVINAGPGYDYVTLGSVHESVHAGTGNLYVSMDQSMLGATLDGAGASWSQIELYGTGGTYAMGANITGFNGIDLNGSGFKTSSAHWNFTMNATKNLILWTSEDGDTITLGDASQKVYGGNGNDTFVVSAATAGAYLDGRAGKANTIEVAGGGTAVLNAKDIRVQDVKLDATTNVTLFNTNKSVDIEGNAAALNGSTVLNFGTNDTVDVLDYHTPGMVNATFVNGVLAASETGDAQTISLTTSLASTGATVVASSDGHGGTLLTLTKLTHAMVALGSNSGPISSDVTTSHDTTQHVHTLVTPHA